MRRELTKRITLFSILRPVLRRCHRKNYGYFFKHICADPDGRNVESKFNSRPSDDGKTVICDNVLPVNFLTWHSVCVLEMEEMEENSLSINSLRMDYPVLTLFTTNQIISVDKCRRMQTICFGLMTNNE